MQLLTPAMMLARTNGWVGVLSNLCGGGGGLLVVGLLVVGLLGV